VRSCKGASGCTLPCAHSFITPHTPLCVDTSLSVVTEPSCSHVPPCVDTSLLLTRPSVCVSSGLLSCWLTLMTTCWRTSCHHITLVGALTATRGQRLSGARSKDHSPRKRWATTKHAQHVNGAASIISAVTPCLQGPPKRTFAGCALMSSVLPLLARLSVCLLVMPACRSPAHPACSSPPPPCPLPPASR